MFIVVMLKAVVDKLYLKDIVYGNIEHAQMKARYSLYIAKFNLFDHTPQTRPFVSEFKSESVLAVVSCDEFGHDSSEAI